MKQLLITFFLLTVSLSGVCQPRYNMQKLQHEALSRGVVAFKKADGTVVVSWRTLAADAVGQAYDIYRNGRKLNASPLTRGGTFFVDTHPLTTDAVYEVRGGTLNGSYTLKAGAPAGYIPIPLDKPADGTDPEGKSYTYSANDASIGDVDGDGNFEIILKWDPSNSKDNSHTGYAGNVLIDCYRLTGEKLWRIDLGRNVRAGAHYTQFIVYDLDGDGKAEVLMKTADGSVDGEGHVIGNGSKDFVCHEEGAMKGRIAGEHDFLTVFEGRTGRALCSADYIPQRGDSRGWGDDHENRSDRMLAGVAYLDGVHPSALFCRGYYTRTVVAAWDWDGRKLTQRWVFDTNEPEWNSYAGQGNHNLRVADVDGDGCDEITYGSMCIDNNGRGLYNTGFGHGDAMHLTAFDPTTDRLQVWQCHENRRDGSDFRDAATGRVLFQLPSTMDVGRCMAADIDPTNPGVEMWSSDSKGIRNLKGEVVTPERPDTVFDERIQQHWNDFMQRPAFPQQRRNGSEAAPRRRQMPDNTRAQLPSRRRGPGLSTNFGIWWDGDLLRELLDHEMVLKYNWVTGQSTMIRHFDGTLFNNWTKSNPCLSADFLGDWREEVVARTKDSRELRVYISDIPTEHRINCLLEDIPYRLSVAAENVAYNQPPELGYYLGPGKTVRPFLK